MRRLLLIAYYFPPLGGAGSLRAVRYVRHLAEFGWDVRVLTPHGGGSYRDHELSVDPERIVRSRTVELSALGKWALRVRTGDGGQEPSGARSLARAAAHRSLYFPDAQIGWYPGAVTAGTRMLRREHFDAILSSAYPVTAHLIARTLQRRSGAPWIAEFRDPWADRQVGGVGTVRRAAALERRLARAANEVVMPSPTWAARYGRLWQRPVVAIPNGCDDDVPEPTPQSERRLSYVGSFYPGLQDLGALWRLMSVTRGGGDPVLLRYVGAMPPELRAEIALHGVGDLVDETGTVTHAEALSLSARSVGLLVAGPVSGDELALGHIPAKVFEYLASGLPIVYIGEPESDVARILRHQPECYLVRQDAFEDLRAAVANCDGRTVKRDLSEFTGRKQAATLAALLGKLPGSVGCRASLPARVSSAHPTVALDGS